MNDDYGSPASELVVRDRTFGVASTVSLTATLRKAYVGVLHTIRCNKL